MKTIVLDMQSELYAQAIRRMLVQELDGVQVTIARHPRETAEECRLLRPSALLMEVTGYTPWQLEERRSVRDAVRRDAPDCKVMLLVDEVADRGLADAVKREKQAGQIDAFLFASASEKYLAAMLDSL